MLEKTYTRDELVALLDGSLANLPSDLKERPDEAPGIWWVKVDDADLQGLPDAEIAALRPHPNDRPTAEPVLPFPFTARQFVAFENRVHIFRRVYLVDEVTYGRDPEQKTRWPESVHWTGINEHLFSQLRARSRHAVDLVRALLGPPPEAEAVDDAAAQALRQHHGGRRATPRSLQEDDVLEWLRSNKHDLQAMPIAPKGNKPWQLREDLRAALNLTKSQAKKTLTRLRADGRIKDKQ